MASDGFRPLDDKSLAEYIKATPSLSSKLGNQIDELQIKEVGDGNLNFVYIVTSPSGSFVIKQALPYIRCIGESWPMTKERAYFESVALKEHGRLCPDHVPEVYHFDRAMSLIGMLAEFCGNVELCRLTEQVVFSDPYKVSQYNHWTSPYLDRDAEAVREDNILKLEVAELKSMFCERAQALIHGDLHTGSVMVTSDSTQVIDPEFAFYGPMGFDIGAFVGNLILAFFAQDGQADPKNDQKRIVGVAHVEDFESIADAGVRANCERRALDFAKMLLKERRKFQGITEVVSAIQKVH
ncbi:hypothetical protein C3L33_20954, partial [Rhododendron williamsianum]